MDIKAYETALEAVRILVERGKSIWVDPDKVNYAFASTVPKERYDAFLHTCDVLHGS